MAYKLKPNYHFTNGAQTGIDKVPVGRFVIVESFGNYNEIKWYKKTSNTNLSDTTTIEQAVTLGNLVSPTDSKRDISDSYSITEVDSALSLKADTANVYDRVETDAMVESVRNNQTGIIQQVNTISQSVTIPSTNNAASISPIKIADNVTITIGNGAVWKII